MKPEFSPSARETLARAVTDLQLGLPVILHAGAERHIVLAAETASTPRIDALSAMPGAHLAITRWRAAALKARVYDGGLARLALPDHGSARWVRAVADPVQDLAVPLKGPFVSLRGGDTAPDMAALRLLKRARLLPAALIAEAPAENAGLTVLSLDQLATPQQLELREVSAARLPLVQGDTRLHIFVDPEGLEEHYALELGAPDRAAPVLCRLHSACFTGDVLGSLKCDCGPQLNAALGQIGEAGAGVLLYLNQEGRGIGLTNKMRAYALQDQGFDTVEANHRLGFEDDERDFEVGSTILKALGFSTVRLMTNNPAKIDAMRKTGIEVSERVAHHHGQTTANESYLRTKAAKSGHMQ